MKHTHIDTVIDILEKDVRIALLKHGINAGSGIRQDIQLAFENMREGIKDRIIHNEN